MTARGPRKKVDAHFWQGRLDAAKDFLQAAEQAFALAEPGSNANPIISQIALAAIAYGDCLTAREAQVVNQQDHRAASRLLREVLQNTLPDIQERRFRRILGYKDEVQYCVRRSSLEEAHRLLNDIRDFAQWAEDQVG